MALWMGPVSSAASSPFAPKAVTSIVATGAPPVPVELLEDELDELLPPVPDALALELLEALLELLDCPGHGPQSAGQLEHVSWPLHTPLPQRDPPVTPSCAGIGSESLSPPIVPPHAAMQANTNAAPSAM
jgi:hypothetical protein